MLEGGVKPGSGGFPKTNYDPAEGYQRSKKK